MSDSFTTKSRTWIEPFLKALSIKGIVGQAARSAGISRRAAYAYREIDAEFAMMWDDAVAEAVERMEEEMHRRAVDGVVEPVFGPRGQVGEITKYSDTLLIFALKGNNPGKYRDRVDIQNSGKIQVEYVNDWRDKGDDQE